jgi:hypothetical protein
VRSAAAELAQKIGKRHFPLLRSHKGLEETRIGKQPFKPFLLPRLPLLVLVLGAKQIKPVGGYLFEALAR